MGEIKNPENSGVSDPSNSETPEEVIDNNDDTSGDNGTSDIDRSENNENSENDPSTELEEGEKIEEEVIEATPEEDASALQNSETDSLEEADQVQTTIALYEKDAEGNPVALDSAKVQYTDGCASEDGQTVRKDSDITFRVIPNSGRKVKAVSYAVIDASAEFTKDTTLTPASGDPYKIEKSKVAAEKVIAIVVETEEVSFTLSASGGTLVKVETDATTSKQKLTNLTGNDLKFAYGEASSIALNVSGLTKDAKYEAEAAVAGGDPYDLGEGSQTVISADNSSTGAELVYRTYSLPATALNGVDDNVDQTVTITFTPVGTVTVDASAATVGDGYTVATQAVDANNDDQKDYVPYKSGANDTYDAGDEVVFAVAPITTGTANNYEVVENGVKVTLVNEDTDDEKSITPSVVTDTFITDDNTAEKEVYAAKIPADIAEGYTLKIDVTTKFKTDADTVTVKFELDEKDKDKVTIKGGTASANEEKEPNQEIKFLKGAAVTKYDIAVSVKDGYKLSKLEVKRTGKKDDNTAAPDLTADLIADDVKDGGAVYSKSGSITLRETVTPEEEGSQAYNWIVDTVTVSIAVVPDDAGEEKTVTFTSKSGLGEYSDGIPCEIEVTEDETVEYDGSKTNGTATLAESAQYLSFRVKAETEPEVTAETKEVDGTAVAVEKLGAAGGYYSYQIPAKNFEAEGGVVTVTRKTKDITAEITDGYVGWEYESKPSKSGYLSANDKTVSVDADETIVFTVDQEDYERPIASVTYKLGEDGAATPVAEGNGGVYEFAVKASDNITVSVLCETDERIRVNGSLIVPGATKQVDYDKEITARLEDKDGRIIDIVNAMVYDGTALADTKPTVADNVAKFTVSEKEQEQDLTVTLVKKKGEKVSFNIKSDKKVSGVSFTGLGEDKTVTLAADESVTLGVEAAEGNVNRLQIAFFTGTITDDSKVENSSTYILNDNVYADYDDGSLTITAKSNKTANANAGTIVLCRPDGGVIKDSAITVKTEAPFMTKEAVADYTKLGKVIGKHVTVEMTDAALQNVQSEMNKVSNYYNSDPYYYNIKVDTSLIPAATAVPADYTGDDWKTDREAILNNLSVYTTTDGKKVTLGELIRNGGEKIQLIPDSVAPLALSFKVTVTPVQRLSSNEVVSGTGWTSDAFSTVAVNYSDTLNLGKNKVTLQTGRDEDIVVATPVFAGNNDRYEWVDVEIIDSTTGKPHNKAGKFTANWNAKDKVVTVNAKEATANDNNKKLYKNLAVKVTVYTEDSDYGVSAVKALGVESGISNVSLDLQKEIVYTGKKVTVGGTVTYNGGESENAPKKKAAVYSLANVGKALQGDKVTINAKNGKVTLAAGITLSENEADNRFTVVAKANDYESNPREDSVTVTVVGEAEAFQEAALFEAGVNRDGDKDWSHASKVDITSVEVKETSGLYRVAALKIGAKANRDGSYNLYDYDNVAYDTGLLTFKSSNKNIVVYASGAVEVKKVGKTNITVQVRSDKKKTATLKNVNFVVEKTPIVAVLTEYENSKFEDNTELADSIFAENGKYEAQGNSTGYYKLELKKEIGVDRDGNKLYDDFTLPNYSISFKNAKKAADKDLNTDNRVIYFTATGGGTDKNKTVVTITNKEKDQKLNKIVIDIVNAKKESAKNAPKVQMADKRQKIYAGVGANVSVSVIPAKKTDMIWSEEEDTYIVLSIDQSKAKDSDNINAMFSGYLDRPIALERVSDTEGRFSLNVFNNTAGSYSLVAALGTMKDGVFTQTHKDAALTLKVTKSNDKIKATTKYTLNPFGTSSKPFVVNGGSYDVTFADTSDWYTDVTNAQGQVVDTVYTNYAKNMILSTGKANEFNRYFTITATEGNGDDVGYVAGSRIGIRKDLSQDEIATLLNKEAMKDNLTGYVSVTNGVRVVDLKVTVTVESEASKIKLSTKTTPTITGKVVTDIVVMNGKDTVDIESYQITAKSGKKMEFASYYETVTKDAAEDVKKTELEAEQGRLSQGVIRVIAENASTGNHEFEVSVITKDMVDSKKFTKNEANQDVYNYAIAPKASGKIAVAEPKNAKNKVVFAKGDTNWKVESTDWQADKDETSTWYIWSTDRKFTFKNRLSGVAKIKVTTEDKYAGWFIVDPWDEGVYNESGEQNINLIVDKDGLKAAVEAPKSKLKYGKACKVKATFSYLDAEGNEITTLPKDTVTFNITLPNAPESQEASALTTLLNAKRASLQNLADRKTKEYERVVYINNADRQKEEVKKAANAVAEILLNEVKRLANGTTAILKVVPDEKNTAEKYSYAVKVNDETVFTLVSRCNGYSALQKELGKIVDGLAGNDVKVNKDEWAEKFDLEYNPVTTADSFKTKLVEALNAENVLTNSMVVSVSRDEEQTYAPTTEKDGYFKANVKVIDKNIRRGEDADGVIADEELSYTFDSYTDAKAYKQNGANSIATTLDATKMAKLINETYEKVTDGIKEDNEFTDGMKTALKEAIKKYADEEIDNQYLTVKEVSEEGYDVEVNGSDWKISFVVSYEGEESFDVEASVTVAQSTFTGKQNVDAFMGDVESAKGTIVLSSTTSAAAVEEAKDEIKNLSTNPNYNNSGKLDVSLNGEEKDAFLAPTTEAAGWVNVKVDFAHGSENPADASKNGIPYTFIINKLPAEGDEEIPTLEPIDKAKAAVQSSLTNAVINEKVAKAWEDAVEAESSIVGMNGFAKDDTRLLAELKGAVTGLPSGIEVADDGVEVASIALPEDTDKAGSYGAITVTLNDSESTKVTIPGGTIAGAAVYQAEESFKTAMVTEVNKYEIPYNSEWIEDGAVKDGGKTAILGAITDQAKALVPEVTENPLYLKKGTESNNDISAVEKANNGTTFTVNTNGSISVANVGLKFAADDSSPKTVSVKVLAETEMKTVASVKIDKVDNVTVAAGTNDGSDASKAFPIESATAAKTVTFSATVTGDNENLTADDKKVTWELKSATNGTDDFENASNADDGGNIGIDKDTGVLTIPKEAYVAGVDSIKAAVVATSVFDKARKDTFYVEIKLDETIDTVTITGSTDTIEAPKGSEEATAVTYTATLSGSHVKAATKVAWTNSGNNDETNVTIDDSVDNKATVQVAVGAKANTALKLTATHGEGQTAKKAEKTITIVANDKIDTNTTIGFAADGTRAVWADGAADQNGTLTIQNQDTNDVLVPISITSGRDLTAEKAVVTVTNAEGGVAPTGITVVDGTGKNRGKSVLKIANTALEIPKADNEATPKVDPTVLKLTATLPAGAGQAAATEEFSFNIVIVKHITDVNVVVKDSEGTEIEKVNGVYTVHRGAADADITVGLTESKVIGAHVNSTAAHDDQKIKWVITSKNSASQSTIDQNGTLTIKEGGTKDYLIKVKAVSVAGSTAEKEISKTVTIKLVP